jgi:hypothetical protein
VTAADLLTRCRTLGVTLAAGPDGTLTWEARAEPSAELLADLARHKVDVLNMLASDAWMADAIAENLGLPPGSIFIDRASTLAELDP